MPDPPAASETPPPNRFTISRIAPDRRRIVIDWADGHRSAFHNIWLRYNCDCDTCGRIISAIRHLRLADMPLDIAPIHTAVNAQGQLDIAWPPDGHRTVYGAPSANIMSSFRSGRS